ncbi:MAG TPA: M56 family metallopeptidase, partial [Planctomycetaceae bacterium]|nr:M56 family metallopeptidase [Planctomycetaceae bacterium]
AVCGIWQSVRSARAVRRVVDEARLVQDAATLGLVAEVCRRLHWDGVVDLRQSSRTAIPLCVGWKRPCILLPPDWRTWGDMTLRAVLAHEVSHIVRRDVAWQMVARVACYLYWFHPLVWLAARKMRVERETACDDSVLAIVERPVDYASVLLRFAREMVAHRTPAAALPMSSFSGLEGRVRAILDKSRPRSPVGPRVGRMCAFAAVGITLAAASLSPLSSEGVASAKEGITRGIESHESTPNGVGDPQSEWIRINAAQRALGQQHLPPAPAGEITGRVVLTSDAQKGLARARILGIPENPKASYVTAVADAQGNFHLPRLRSAMLFLAQSDERNLSGMARVESTESTFVIPVGRPVSAKGRLLSSEGEPLGKWPIDYYLVPDGGFTDEFIMFQARDAKKMLGGYTSTGPNGHFTVPGLAPGWKYRITCCPGTLVGGANQSFVTITNFTTALSGVTQLGNVKRPPTPTMEDAFLSATSAPEKVEKVRETASESARMLDQRVLVVAGSPANEVVRGIRAVLALDSPVPWNPNPPKGPGDPDWAKTGPARPDADSLHVALNNFAVMGLDVDGADSTTRAFLDRYQVAAPPDGDVTLAALDIDGRLVAQTTGRQLFAGKPPTAKPLTKWLASNAPKLPDANRLRAEALAQAKRENKCVLLLETAPGRPAEYCCRMSRYLEENKNLLEKDYVCLKIDIRYANASMVIDRIRDFDASEYYRMDKPSLPWMVILDADGHPAASGTSPRGNIGVPDTAQETSYFAWMLRATAQRLTDDEITTLVSALNKDKR